MSAPFAMYRGGLVAKLSDKIMELSRDTLLLNLRFMERALVWCEPAASTRIAHALSTDGQRVYYDPGYIVRAYRDSQKRVNRAYMHSVLHCLFRHLFFDRKLNSAAWDLATDIAVEGMIDSLGLPCLATPRSELLKRESIIAKLVDGEKALTAERLYRYFMDEGPDSEHFAALRGLFYADDHSLWYEVSSRDEATGAEKSGHAPADMSGAAGDGEDGDTVNGADMPRESGEYENGAGIPAEVHGDGADGGDGSGQRDGKDLRDEDAGGADGDDSMDGDEGDGYDIAPSLSKEELEQIWKDIGKKAERELESSPETWGKGAGDMMQELARIGLERYDYGEFLRRFACLGENMEVNDDEFDYVFYCYGLGLFGNMPLVEPLEYREVKRVRDLAIVLDTSQSVAGGLVQSFVTKTYNILKQEESFFSRFNVHIIQCGASVQEDAAITTQEEFDRYIESMVLHGFGGTDFRPAFAYVDELVRQHRFSNLKGLIYFTDGYGDFPQTPPAYDTAFVFVGDGSGLPAVPPWAIRLLLSEEELDEELRGG